GVRGGAPRHRAHQEGRAHLEEGGSRLGRDPLGDGFVSSRDLAVDLGTANTLVYQQGRGVVYDEPTVVAVNARTGQVLSAGSKAWRLLAESPGNVQVVRPLERGVIADFEMTASMLRLIFRSLGVTRFPRPRALVCVPSTSTKVERRAVEEAV